MNRRRVALKGSLAWMLRRYVALAALTASAAASANSQTYDFTGTVTASDFASITTGVTITGTYTINLANADPLISDNGINPTTPWTRAVLGGAAFNAPVPTGTVFSSSATAGSSVFASSAPSAFGSYSQVTGGSFFYNANDIEYTSNSSFTESIFHIDGSSPFTSNGLPLLGAGSMGTGSIFFATNVTTGNGLHFDYGPQLDYSITSLKPVMAPEINPASAAGGLLMLLGALAVIRGRRAINR